MLLTERDKFVQELGGMPFDMIAAIESRGFFFGAALAQRMQLPFIPVRKAGKLPGDTLSYSYDLEYGSATLEMQKLEQLNGKRVLVHDDLLATGGTAAATAELIQGQGASVGAFSFLISLDFLKGQNKLVPYCKNIFSLVSYEE